MRSAMHPAAQGLRRWQPVGVTHQFRQTYPQSAVGAKDHCRWSHYVSAVAECRAPAFAPVWELLLVLVLVLLLLLLLVLVLVLVLVLPLVLLLVRLLAGCPAAPEPPRPGPDSRHAPRAHRATSSRR